MELLRSTAPERPSGVPITQMGNHFKLSAIHPSREGNQQNPPSDVEHPPSLLATAALGKSQPISDTTGALS